MTTETVTKEKIKIPLCQECNEGAQLYQCPGCARRTCCLACCKSHKERTGCNGKRNRTQYMPLAHMNDATMQSDYHFLEDVLQTVDGGKRLLRNVGAASTQQQQHENSTNETKNDGESVFVHPMLKIQQVNDEEEPQPKRHRSNNKWQRLVQQAELRATTLMLMPSGMQRHATNTTWYHQKTDTMYWKVDLNIHEADNTRSSRLVSIAKLDENATLGDELKKAFPSLNTDYHLLLKQLPCPSNQPRFIELDRETTLKNALRDQTIIEYPTIEVVPTQALPKFPRAIEEI